MKNTEDVVCIFIFQCYLVTLYFILDFNYYDFSHKNEIYYIFVITNCNMQSSKNHYKYHISIFTNFHHTLLF